MRNSSAKLLACIMALVMLLAVPTNMVHARELSVKTGWGSVSFSNQPPVIVDDVAFVPARDVLEALGFEVYWNDHFQLATSQRDEDLLILVIDSYVLNINGEVNHLDVPAQFIDGQTMMPIRPVLESVGYIINWDEDISTIFIESSIQPFQADWIQEGLYGFMDADGNLVMHPVFNAVSQNGFVGGLAAVATDYEEYRLWGFVDRYGNEVIPMIYDWVDDFSGGFAMVKVGDYYGIIDRTGHLVIPTIYNEINRDMFVEGLVTVRQGNLWGVINNQGQEILPPIFRHIGPFEYGHAEVFTGDNMRRDRRWGLINVHGEIVLPARHSRQDIDEIISLKRRPAETFPENVEQGHWREVRRVLPLHTDIQIIDVWTGTIYYVRSMSNGFHADVETIDAANTALHLETFGGVQTWSSRPVWVRVGDRFFSAAIHSMQHSSTIIANNNMDGHVCLHFYGSTTHNTELPVYLDTVLEAQRMHELVRGLR